jgi:hypothetical protein
LSQILCTYIPDNFYNGGLWGQAISQSDPTNDPDDIKRITINQTFDGQLSWTFNTYHENKFVKKTNQTCAPRTLSFFSIHKPHPKKLKECLRLPKKQRQKQAAPKTGLLV